MSLVTVSNLLPIGSLEIADKCTTASTWSRSLVRKLPNVAKHLAIQQRFREKARASQTVAKERRIETDQLDVYEIFTKRTV